MKYKILSILVVLFLLCGCFALPVAAAADPVFTLGTVTGTSGETVAVTVALQDAQSNVGGLRLSVAYDTQKLTYVNGSRMIQVSGVREADLNPDKAANGRIYFSWCAEHGLNMQGNLVTFQFKIHADAQPGNAALVLTVHEMFTADAAMTDLISASKTVAGHIAVTGAGAAAQNVINMINAIGNVTLDASTKAKIDAAMAAYAKLSYDERMQVSNYSQLLEAQDTYKQLYNQSTADQNAAAASAYRAAHSAVLSKTVQTLTLQDKAAVMAALEAWKTIPSVAVQGLLIQEKILLNQFVTRLQELQNIEDDRLEAEALQREAEQIAADFREFYKQVLSKTVEEINTDYRQAVEAALGDIESYGFVNSLVPGLLQEEKTLLLAFQEKINQGEPEVPAYETEAARFRRNFSYIIHMEPGDLTQDEYYDVKVALGCYELLSSDAQALLDNEYALLVTLSETLEGMPELPASPAPLPDPEPEPGSGSNSIPEQQPEEPGDEEEAPSGETASVIYNRYRKIHPALWWVLANFVVCMLALTGSVAVYYRLKHKQTGKTEQKGGQEGNGIIYSHS